MTRGEAINRFKGIRESFSISIAQSKFYPSKAELDELCDMAIEALSAKPTIPTFAESAEAYKAWTGEEMGRPHGRLIDADKLKKQLDTVYNEMANERERKGLRLARWFLISAPTVSADRPHGEWIEFTHSKVYMNGEEVYAYMNNYTCSVCGGEAHLKYDYCPNCGANMGGDVE